MQRERLIDNIENRMQLLRDLVRVGGYSRFSYILDSYAFARWRNRYQLYKAIGKLIEEGYIKTKFKGYNRFGYMTYAATDKAIARVNAEKEAHLSFDSWTKVTHKPSNLG